MQNSTDLVRALIDRHRRRGDFWRAFAAEVDIRTMAEIGVYKGDFAHTMLSECPQIRRYHMVDPWRQLDDWNKPMNQADDSFAGIMAEALAKTEPWADRRVVHRGTTTEVIDEIEDGSLDLAYVDGDHTLRGITVDLIRVLPKVREGGWLAGDDFSESLWQHKPSFEPTLVFPFAVHFAEAIGTTIHALPRKQFLMRKPETRGSFAFVDLTGNYPETALLGRRLNICI